MNRVITFIVAMGLMCCGEGAALAKVDKADDAGFVVSFDLYIAASPNVLWATLITPKNWWNGEHSWSGDAANFWMKPMAGGCFCETLPISKARKKPGFVEHARIIYADPGSTLRLSGVLGPLQTEALAGTMSYSITAGASDPTTSKLKVEYIVGGYSRIPLKSLAPIVDKVLAEQMARLKVAAEIGRVKPSANSTPKQAQ